MELTPLKNNLDSINKIDVDKVIVRTNDLGALDFKSQKDDFIQLQEIVNEVSQLDLTNHPSFLLLELNSVMLQFLKVVGQIANFKIESGQAERNELINKFNTGIISMHKALLAVLTWYKLIEEKKRVSIDTLNAMSEKDVALSSKETVDRINQLATLFENELKKSKNKFDLDVMNYKASIDSRAQELGVSKYSNIFLDESVMYQKSADNWLKFTFVLIVGLVVGLVALFTFVEVTFDDPRFIQYSVTKILVITLSFYAVNMSLKNYRANKHNHILNRHRHNALATFETFTQTTQDSQTKSAILLEATHTIFGNQSTGYSTESNDGEISNKIIEIIKSPSKPSS